jgi:hypothetical protein
LKIELTAHFLGCSFESNNVFWVARLPPAPSASKGQTMSQVIGTMKASALGSAVSATRWQAFRPFNPND